MNLIIPVFPQKRTKFLFIIVLILVGLSLLTEMLSSLSGNKVFELISAIFNLDKERNLPTLFSVLILWSASFLCAIITVLKKRTRQRYIIHWGFLAVIFLILGWDEGTQIHDSFLGNSGITDYLFSILGIEKEGFFTFRWVVVALPVVFLLGASYIKFIWSLPVKQKQILILAAIAYLMGALGMEAITGFLLKTQGITLVYSLMNALEELLEMSGIIIFIYFLLLHLSLQIEQININFIKVNEAVRAAGLINEKTENYMD